ncbi:MAG TPA: hypothetical protein VFQ61_20995, partial [Polyangiaceae bacterium]|nr:hypothetical protein [Polyangiaceae bacterium]
AGTFEIRDELAPSVRMWVVADPNVAAITYPSMKGDFSLTVENAGDYKVQAFFSGKRVGSELPVAVEKGDVDTTKNPIKLVDERAQAKAAKDDAEGGAEPKADATDNKGEKPEAPAK